MNAGAAGAHLDAERSGRVVWVDASSGASGDMLLAALHDAGVPAEVMARAASAVAPVAVRFWHEQRAGFGVGRASVASGESPVPQRTWADVRELLDSAELEPTVRRLAHAAFERLARAEGVVHGVSPDAVHFHEVGAHDAIGDIVGVCAGFTWLGGAVRVGPIALGGGAALAGHGTIPVPGPAVLALLAGSGAVAHGGPVDTELCTPTGAALLLTLATSHGPLPPMSVAAVGLGAGSRVQAGRLGALRLVVGASARPSAPASDVNSAVVLETNVDDLDPRVWPHVLAQLLACGASDAWLTPILMKKGRPAHTLHVLAADEPALLQRLRAAVFAQTSAIGLRERSVTKTALARRQAVVDVAGQPVRVKLAHADGVVLNAQPEFDDLAAAADALGLPLKVVLARAGALAAQLLGDPAPPS